MSTIVLQNVPYADGGVSNIGNIDDNFFNPKAAPDSFDVVNGFLESTNFDAGYTSVDYQQVAKQSFTKGWTVAGTANLDYFDDSFGSVSTTPADDAGRLTSYIPLAGLNLTANFPWECQLLFMWQYVWTNSNIVVGQHSATRFFLDGTSPTNNPTRRYVGRTRWFNGGVIIPPDTEYNGRRKGRFYIGHYLTDVLPRGIHTGGIYLLAHNAIKQTRVRCRSIKVIAIRNA